MTRKNVTAMFFMQTISPLHIGVGEGVGHINLPTAREVTTQYPYVPGSSIKGVLRDAAEAQYAPQDDGDRYGWDPVVRAFGPPTSRAGDARGGLVFSDANLLFLPMRSLVGGFALVTCPLCLRRLRRDLALCGQRSSGLEALAPMTLADGVCLVTPESVLEHAGQVLLEDLPLTPETGDGPNDLDDLGRWLSGKAWPAEDEAFQVSRLAVVSDTLFGFFVRLYLEVRHRVHIDDETGTAAKSGPWLEEYIPAEAILFGVVHGRKTVVRMKPPGEGEEDEDNTRVVHEEDSLRVLSGVVSKRSLLRFGGKSSGGAGRAFFRLVDPVSVSEEGQA